MPNKSDFIRTRIEPELKAETEEILKKLGISMSEAVTVFCRQIVMQKGLPFDVKIPNSETIAAFEENLSNAKKYQNTDQMFDEILSETDKNNT